MAEQEPEGPFPVPASGSRGRAEAAPRSERSASSQQASDRWRVFASASTGRKAKISATVDETLWREVQSLIDDQAAAETASAAVEQGLGMWVANQRLARVLDELYEQDPRARPTSEEVTSAAKALGL